MSDNIKDKYDVVISYIRFSSAIQEKGDSIRRQNTNAKRFIEDHGLTLSDISYSDLGKSGYKGEHLKDDGGLRSFIEAVRADTSGLRFPKGRTLLLIDEWSRFSRLKPMVAQGLVGDIVGLGCDIATCDDNSILSEDADIGSMLTAIIKMNSAFEESDRKSRHLKAAWDGKRKALLNNPNAKKLTSRCPSWLSLDRTTNQYIEIDERVETVKLIYKLYLDGLGRSAIAKKLNSDKVDTFGDSVKSARQSPYWRESSITKILSESYGRAVLGEYQMYRMEGKQRVKVGDAIKDYYPSIIPEDDFYQAQHLRVSRTIPRGAKGTKLTNLFQGLVHCEHCDSSMTIVDKGKNSSGKSLVCSNAKLKAGCDQYVPFHYATVEQAVLSAIRNIDYSTLLNTTKSDEALNDLNVELITATGKLAVNKKGITHISEAISKMGFNSILEAKLLELGEEERTLESDITSINTQLASYQVKEQSKQSVWELLNEVVSYSQSKLSDNEIYAKRAKLVLFLNAHIERIDFWNILMPMTKELASYGRGKNLIRVDITVTLKGGDQILIRGISKPRAGLHHLISVIEDREINHTFQVITRRDRHWVDSEVVEYSDLIEVIELDPNKYMVMGSGAEDMELLGNSIVESKHLSRRVIVNDRWVRERFTIISYEEMEEQERERQEAIATGDYEVIP